tara:strand:+ start:21804 stop:23018 length:1215 start_codon:yes stop_codon:yes gene_type:complete
MRNLNIPQFISENITFRKESMFAEDLKTNHEQLSSEIKGKTALVIGGAGTIGSSFIRAMLKYEPAKLIVVDTNENGLTELTRDLRSSYGMKVPEFYKTYPLNFADPVFYRMFQNEGPFDIVANFAAHKHVRSEKDHYSITALIDNNVLKAEILLKELLKFPPKHFFCVSTDKAANPVNIMGASKKIMEEVIMAYSREYPISTARFANVAFSNGSLLDGFISRLIKKQPFSAPSDVKRYFVSPDESGQICLMACVLGKSGDIFFPRLKAEQMVTFAEISDRFLRTLGYEPLVCSSEEEAKQKALDLDENSTHYPVFYFGSDTSGEKSFEEFFTDDEILDEQSFSSLGVIKNAPKKELSEVGVLTSELSDLLAASDISKAGIVIALSNFLPNFKHIETGKSLDQKM